MGIGFGIFGWILCKGSGIDSLFFRFCVGVGWIVWLGVVVRMVVCGFWK